MDAILFYKVVPEALLETAAWIIAACIVKSQWNVIKEQDVALTAVSLDGVTLHVTQVLSSYYLSSKFILDMALTRLNLNKHTCVKLNVVNIPE